MQSCTLEAIREIREVIILSSIRHMATYDWWTDILTYIVQFAVTVLVLSAIVHFTLKVGGVEWHGLCVQWRWHNHHSGIRCWGCDEWEELQSQQKVTKVVHLDTVCTLTFEYTELLKCSSNSMIYILHYHWYRSIHHIYCTYLQLCIQHIMQHEQIQTYTINK